MRDERNSKRITWTRTSVGYRVMADGKRSYCYRFRDADGIQRCTSLARAQPRGRLRLSSPR